jgi:pilus assembly protein Flp/PilA
MQRIFKLVFRLRCLMILEDGQDLVEYALIVALIALGATAGMKTLATGIGTAFSHVSPRSSAAPSLVPGKRGRRCGNSSFRSFAG